MINRMIRAACLNVQVFEEVEADKSATVQAFLVVVLVAFATGIASVSKIGIVGLFVGVLIAIVGWAIWAWIVYIIGTKILSTEETDADWGQVARTVGFAQSVGILRVLGIVPVVGGYIFVAVSLWMLVAMVIGVRQALDYTSTLRTIAVVLLGYIPYVVLMLIGLSVLGGS